MPVYRATHSCGYTNEVFLKADKNTMPLRCKRCGGTVVARQIRDPQASFSHKDEVTGIYKNDDTG